jgi:hypothetical protein
VPCSAMIRIVVSTMASRVSVARLIGGLRW